MTVFVATYAPIYATTKELKKMEFMLKRQNMKQAIGIQVTSSRKISIKKNILLSVHFEPLLGWECTLICHDLRTEKQDIYVKKRENERNN